MAQQNIGNNSFTFVINNFQQDRKQHFHGEESHVSSKHNFKNSDYSKIDWPNQHNSLNGIWSNLFEGNSQKDKKRKSFVGSNSFSEQKPKTSFENTAGNSKKRKNQKRRKRNRDYTGPTAEFSQFFTGTNYYKSSLSSTIPKYYADNHTNRNKDFINVNASNSYNVSYKRKKNRKDFIKWKYTTNNFETNRSKSNNKIQSNGFKSNVNEKEDGDLFYFDIGGHKTQTGSVAPREDKLNVSKIIQNYNEHLNKQEFSINGNRLNWSNNTNTKQKINETSLSYLSDKSGTLKSQKIFEETFLDLSKEGYLDASDPASFKKVKHEIEKPIREEEILNCTTDSFGCDTSSIKDINISIEQSRKRKKRKSKNQDKNIVKESKDLNCSSDNIFKTKVQSCDENDSLIDVESDKIDMLNYTKEETSKKKKKKRKKKNEDEETLTILDSDCEVSSITTKTELNKSNSDYMLSEKGKIRQHVEDQISRKIKKKKNGDIRNLTVNTPESDCEIIDFIKSSPKKSKHITVGAINTNTLKKKHKIIEENYDDKDICISDNINNILRDLATNSKNDNNGKESDKQFVVDQYKLPKVKKKKHKKSIEDYNDEPENENYSLSTASGATTNSVSKAEKLKVKSSNDTNTSECEIIDFVSSNKKKKKRKSTAIEFNDNDTHKKKHKIKTSRKDIEENLFEIIDNGVENALKLPKKGVNGDNTELAEISVADSLKPVKSKKKKRKIKNEEIIEEYYEEANNRRSAKEKEFPDPRSEYLKSLENSSEIFIGSPGNGNYEMSRNVERKTKRISKKLKETNCNVSKDSSEDDCDIVDYVNLKSKKKRSKTKKRGILEIKTEIEVLDNSNTSLKKHRLNSRTTLETNDNSCNFDNNSSDDSSEIISFQWKFAKHNTKIDENGSNVKGKSKKKVKDTDASTIISESECEIIDFVNSNSKKRRKSTTVESDFYETPKKKHKTVTVTTNPENDLLSVSNKEVTNNYDKIEQNTVPPISNQIFGKPESETCVACGDIEKLQNKNYDTYKSKRESIDSFNDKEETELQENLNWYSDFREKEHGKENGDEKSKRKMSLFAEYMQNKENGKTEKQKLIIPEEPTDPDQMEEDVEKLRNLTVIFPFSICRLHSLVTTTCKPKQDQLEKIEQMNVPIKSGIFTKEEDEKIMENWRRLCKEHDLPMNPSIFLKFPTKVKMDTKMDILRYIAHGLDDRLLHRVYIRFRHLLEKGHIKTGRFTAEEDEEILQFLQNTKSRQPFSILSKILCRTRLSIERRYNILQSKDKGTTHWSVEMVDRLVSRLLKITKCEGLEELKHREITPKEWQKMSKKLNLPVAKLKRAWKVTIYPRLYSEEYDLKEVKEDIIKILYDRKETDWRTVNWKEISLYFNGLTPEKIYMMFKHIVNFQVPIDKRSDLKECLDFLKNEFLKYYGMAATHRFKKYVLKDGHITYETSQ